MSSVYSWWSTKEDSIRRLDVVCTMKTSRQSLGGHRKKAFVQMARGFNRERIWKTSRTGARVEQCHVDRGRRLVAGG